MSALTDAQACDCGDHAWMPLQRGYVALVSPHYAALLTMWKWRAFKHNGSVYVRRTSSRLIEGKICNFYITLHKIICPCGGDFVPDHKNGNALDNRDQNLEPCTSQVNSHRQRKKKGATSKYKGVSAKFGKWRATIHKDRKHIHIGLFDDEVEAARAYDAVARDVVGVSAMLNFPQDAGGPL
jgi:hypothetical protein